MPALRTRDTYPSSAAEVTTDHAPHAPVLRILSPTPRAFTFPITHNLSDGPYPSPSNSPFQPLEPDLYPLTLQCTSTLSSPSTFTPPLPGNSVDLVDRRPRKGDEDYVKRPENAFILFRRKCCEDRQQAGDVAAADGPTKKQRQADLSKTISQQWKSLSVEERRFWEQMAKDKKKEHEQLYPNYVYRPQRAKDKDGKTKNKKTKKVDQDTGSSLSFVVPVHQYYSRSASAPTPPPYPSVQIPNVYHMTPSCPSSPSLLPMICRRSAHPGHLEEVMSSFDYLPNNAVIPENYVPSDPCTNNNVDAQAQAEIDLQIEMSMQQEFAACYWGNSSEDQSLWGLLRDDFDLNSIPPPIELGMPKYTENLTMAGPNTSGLEFGHEFTQHVLEGQQYLDDSQNRGDFLGFDEMMTGHGF